MDQVCCKPRLLAIDDHRDSAELIVRVAEKLGFEAKAASTPDVLRAQLATWRPDIVTVDLCMPEEDGFEVFVLLGNLGFTGRVIIISGRDEWLRKSATVLATASRSGGARRARGNRWPVLGSTVRATPVLAWDHSPGGMAGAARGRAFGRQISERAGCTSL